MLLFSSGLGSSAAVIQLTTVIKCCCYSAQDCDQVLLLFSSRLWSSDVIQLRTWIKCCCYSAQYFEKMLLLFSWGLWSSDAVIHLDCDQVMLFSSLLGSNSAVIQIKTVKSCCCYSAQDWKVLLLFSSWHGSSAAVVPIRTLIIVHKTQAGRQASMWGYHLTASWLEVGRVIVPQASTFLVRSPPSSFPTNTAGFFLGPEAHCSSPSTTKVELCLHSPHKLSYCTETPLPYLLPSYGLWDLRSSWSCWSWHTL
jgi:hypothetical protein